MARGWRSSRRAGSAAPASCAAACRRSCWSTARNSPTPSPTPPGSAGRVAPPSFDWPSLIAAKNKELDRLEQIYVNMLRNSGVEIIEGRGVLVDPHTVEVAGRRYTADNILIATGGASDGAEHPRHRARDLVERGARPAGSCRARSSSSAAAISRSSSPASSAASARRSSRSSGARNCSTASTTTCASRWRRRCAAAASRSTPAPRSPGSRRTRARAIRSSPISARRSRPISSCTRPAAGPTREGSGSRRSGSRRNDKGAVQVDEWQKTSVPEHLRGRRRDRPAQPDPGRDRRGPRHRRDAVQQQPDQDGPRRRADRGVQPAADRHGRPDRGTGAPSNTATMSMSIAPASGR